MKRGRWRRWFMAVFFAGVALMGATTAYAEAASPSGIKMGTSALFNPSAPVNASGKWSNGNGCYVYFGRFPQSDTKGIVKEPVKWRVLNMYNDSKGDGVADSIFLLSDKSLYRMPLSDHYGDSLLWEYSNMRAWLNSQDFSGNYLEGGFYDNAFTGLEKEAINSTVTQGEVTYPQIGAYPIFSDFPINGDKIFIPSMNEVENFSHGFYRTLPYYAGGSPEPAIVTMPSPPPAAMALSI